MYYQSQWEQVLYYSTNSRENLRLMKVVALAIEVNYKPFYLTGLSYFQVSIQTVIKVLLLSLCSYPSSFVSCLMLSISFSL